MAAGAIWDGRCPREISRAWGRDADGLGAARNKVRVRRGMALLVGGHPATKAPLHVGIKFLDKEQG